jgi:hypothetical protein
MKRILAISVMAILFFLSLESTAAQPVVTSNYNNNIQVQNDNITIQVTGDQNVPQYTFWAHGQNATKYMVKFVDLFEAIDEDEDGYYEPGVDHVVQSTVNALSALHWGISNFSVDAEGTINFNITSQNAPYRITILNHLSDSALLKFDIKIENYTFSSNDENAMLVLGFHLLTVSGALDESGGDSQSPQATQVTENQINFGPNAYFKSEDKANNSISNIHVGLTDLSDTGQPLAYLAYEHFNGTVLHDPSFGILPNSNTPANLTISGYPLVAFLGLTGLVSSYLGFKKAK